jgi:hypothetical protein
MTASASLPLSARRGADAVAPGKSAKPAAKNLNGRTAGTPAKTATGQPAACPTKRSYQAPVLPPLSFALAIAGVLIYGWQISDEGHLSPESGLGYWLGIAGAGTMLLLLAYPLRKRMAGFKFLGSVSSWFRIHMVLGVIGPALILLHSNFKLGSLNSNVALLAMLVVAGSGLVGRYLYGRIHLGLYGRRAEIGELLAEIAALKGSIEGELLSLPAKVFASLDAHAQRAVNRRRGVVAALLTLVGLRWRSQGLRGRLLQAAEQHIAVEGKRLGWSWHLRRRHMRKLRQHLKLYFAAVNRAAAFVFYERLFALWHVLHLPLFAILVFAAVIHVVAVHLY